PGRMRAFLRRRLLLLVPTLLGVTLATFLMLHLTPGDPVTIMLGEFASASDVARLRAELSLDRPIVVQYLKFLGRAVRGDLGSSIRSRRPVQEELAGRLPPTMVLALAARGAAVVARVTRASVLEVLRQDYVRTARAKGVSGRLVVYRHALRNALIPVLTVAALQFAGLVAGAVIVESVFSRPGLGRL